MQINRLMAANIQIFKTKKSKHPKHSLLIVALAVFMSVFAVPATVYAEGETISGGANITGAVDTWLEVDGVTVSGTTEDPVSVSLSVDSGDMRLQVITGIIFHNDIDYGRSINITGSIDDVNAALDSLQYRNNDAGTVNFVASLIGPGEIYNPLNGHLYEIVDAGEESISANDAFAAAALRTKHGSTGYLMTVTSEAENNFISPRLDGDGWIGARDSEVEGDWKWANGPENGTSFWNGLADGSPVNGQFSNWAEGEPNDVSEDANGEDCAQFYSDGGWNDLSCLNELGYYIVEYGDDGDLPTVSSTDFTIQTTFPEGEVIPIDSCADLIAISENELDHRYDTLQLTQDIDCTEETVTPLFSGEDEEVGIYTFRGTFDGNGFSISNLTMSADESPYGLIKYSEYATFEDLNIASGSVTGSGCVGGLAGEAYNSTFNNISSSVTVNSANNEAGGIVGCLYSNAYNTSEITNSTTDGSVFAAYTAGGIVGYAEGIGQSTLILDANETSGTVDSQEQNGGLAGVVNAEDASTLTISNNETSNEVSGYWDVGGLLGDVHADDTATVHISDNTVSGSVDGESYTGGLIGELETDDDGEILIDNNTAETDVTADYSAGGLVGSIYIEDFGGTVTISNSSTSGEVSVVDDAAGGLVGASGTDDAHIVINIQNSFSSSNVSGHNEVGGLVGFAHRMNITNSYATGTITGVAFANDDYNYSNEIGGLTGESDGTTIIDSYATGDVTGIYEVGGLVGFADLDEDYIYDEETDSVEIIPIRSTIINSYYEGTVVGNNQVGGLVGDSSGGSIIQSYADAVVEGVTNLEDEYYDEELDEWVAGEAEIEPSQVGGLVGIGNYDEFEIYDSELEDYTYVVVPGVIEQSYAVGAVSGNSLVGGLVGYGYGMVMEDSYSKSSVTGNGNGQAAIGGAVGAVEDYYLNENDQLYEYDSLYLDNVYSTGAVTSSEVEGVGGLIGDNMDDFTVTNSFWDIQTSGLNESGAGTGKTTAQMKTIENYTDTATEGLDESWDFSSTWGIYGNINEGYPCLSWSNNSCDPNIPDEDGDGVSDSEETAGPNDGDANNDGVPDSQQPHVASYVNSTTNDYAVLEVNEQCSIQSVITIREADVSNVADSGFDYPAGLMDFRISCGEDGFTATIKQYYYGLTGSFTIRKYIPTSGAYTFIPGATVQNVTIAGKTVKLGTYQLTDGSAYDLDKEIDGIIEDPAGLAQSIVGSPNTGLRKSR